MKKFIFLFLLAISVKLLAQEMEQVRLTEPKEIENKVSAVKNANPGDYILLPSGRKYVLSKEEIAIARDEFDFTNLSNVEKTVNDEGTEVYRISQGHTVYVYPDGQSIHVLKTSISFTAFLRHIQKNYYIAYFIDYFEDVYEYATLRPPAFSVFRASAQFQLISDGIEEMQAVDITMYNYDNENRLMKFTSMPDMIWGNISDRGAYTPVGETRQIDFEVE